MAIKNGTIHWVPSEEFRAQAGRANVKLPEVMTRGLAGNDELGPYVHFSSPGFRVAVAGKPDLEELWKQAISNPPAASLIA